MYDVGGSSATNMAFVCISIVAANFMIVAWSVMTVGADITCLELATTVELLLIYPILLDMDGFF